jgi:hypothetical protein
MLSGKLIHMIETHEEAITNRLLREVRRQPGLAHLAELPEGELREQGREIVKNLGYWLAAGNNQEKLEREYENVGKIRFQESVPLHEAIYGLCLVKYAMLDFINEQGLDRDSMELYAEEELERRVAKFFDFLVIHMARGYEVEWRHEMRAAGVNRKPGGYRSTFSVLLPSSTK